MALKLNPLMLAATIAVGTLWAGVTQASALPVTPSQLITTGDIVPVQYVPRNNMGGGMNWQMQRDGNRCRTWSGNCQHYHQGYYYQTPWWTLPLVIGSSLAIGNNGSGAHVQWCLAHYRSYNPNTDMWFGNDGRHYRCNSGY